MNPGDLVANRYRLDGPIAAGGMGDVWRAHDVVLNRPVALKMLRSDVRVDPTFGDRFRVEARALAAIHHPGVVSVYDYGEFNAVDPAARGSAYLVMAYVDGEPLTARLTAPLDPDVTMDYVAQVARALDAVHAAGIIHRDVKPDNLLISSDQRVVLVDFGIAQSSFASDLTGADQVIGTARYMAPEQVSRHPLSPATDIYALGAVAYQCLAGHPPFDGQTAISIAMSQLRDDPDPLPDSVPAPVGGVVMTALAKVPADRFASASAMAAAAEAARATIAAAAQTGDDVDTTAALAIDPVRVRPPTAGAAPTRSLPTVRRHRGLVGGLIGAALVVAGIVTAVALSGSAGGDPSRSHLNPSHPTSTPNQHPSAVPGRTGPTPNPTVASSPARSPTTGSTAPGTVTSSTTSPSTTSPSTTSPSTTSPSTTGPSAPASSTSGGTATSSPPSGSGSGATGGAGGASSTPGSGSGGDGSGNVAGTGSGDSLSPSAGGGASATSSGG